MAMYNMLLKENPASKPGTEDQTAEYLFRGTGKKILWNRNGEKVCLGLTR